MLYLLYSVILWNLVGSLLRWPFTKTDITKNITIPKRWSHYNSVSEVIKTGQRSKQTKLHTITLYNRYNIKKCENQFNYSTSSPCLSFPAAARNRTAMVPTIVVPVFPARPEIRQNWAKLLPYWKLNASPAKKGPLESRPKVATASTCSSMRAQVPQRPCIQPITHAARKKRVT
jgi:hypothetical protein